MDDLAKQALAVMILDLEYSMELRPMYGHVPIRHQVLWSLIHAQLGEKEFQAEVAKLTSLLREGESPVKTNPWIEES